MAADQGFCSLALGFRALGAPARQCELLDAVLAEIHRHFPEPTNLDRSLERYADYTRETTGVKQRPVDIEEFCAFLDHEHIARAARLRYMER
jgi:hypothetical protein